MPYQPQPQSKIPVLDHGYVEYVGHWGSDEDIVSAARMSTGKGFQGWGPTPNCKHCGAHIESENLLTSNACIKKEHDFSGDEKLLAYLWKNQHTSPFEMAGLTIEVQAPIMVFREWHRHRTQSYNEFSARYAELPDLFYIPSLKRLQNGGQSKTNKQASGATISEVDAKCIADQIRSSCEASRASYEALLALGVSREIARLVIPVNQYSKMRASANLINWLKFLRLRLNPGAQWEIRQYAQAVAQIVKELHPRTYALFSEGL